MNFFISLAFFFMGIIALIAKKDILAVCACFIVYAILEGVNEISLIRKELEDLEDDDT